MTDFPYRVVGIDPSLTATGVADSDGVLSTVKTNAKLKDRRLRAIYAEILDVGDWATHNLPDTDNPPVLAVIEDLPKHAMAAGITGMVQGIVRLALMEHGIPYVTIPPATLKKFASGKGNADKAAMRAKWLEFTGEDNADDNQVDAAFLREIGLVLTGQTSVVPTDQHAAIAGYGDKIR